MFVPDGCAACLQTVSFSVAAFVALTAPAVAQTVTLALTSPQNGATVVQGATIHWSIEFAVSLGNNVGLALLVVDLTQAATNPAKFDLPPADGVPAAMTNFSRPAGISNPGATNPTTGYIGLLRGDSGSMNLWQIGGAQNIFGRARPPGSGVAESASVLGGIGQNGPMTLASGSFAAPATPGAYTFHLENAYANVLTQVNPPPQRSIPVVATVVLMVESMTFTVSSNPCEPCNNCPIPDADGDGVADCLDACPATVPGASVDASGCPSPIPGDFDRDGDVDGSGPASDFAHLLACSTRARVPQSDPGCTNADLDLDQDVDSNDFGIFQRCFSGANHAASPSCAN